MAEQHLHHSQVGAVVEQVRGEGMAQGVGREGFIGPLLRGRPRKRCRQLLTTRAITPKLCATIVIATESNITFRTLPSS
ncbi:hypothetical protein PHLH4_49310 [Pseudomonas sp. St316]|nr:hypothetical protein PHLH4_49310 [Pseudomonas sp. St316]